MKNDYTYNPKFTAHGWDHLRWVENTDRAGLRLVGYADEISQFINHKGWYTDDDGMGDTYRGIVFRLPRGRLVYGYADPCNDGAALLCFDLDATDEADAARYADGLADRFAAEEREANAQYCREQDIDELDGEIVSTLRDTLALIKAAKSLCIALVGSPAKETVTKVLWRDIRAARRDISAARTRRAELVAF